MQLKSRIIRNSFICGSSISVLSILLLLAESYPVLIILSNILPGFIYGIVLCEFYRNRFNIKQLLFIGLSGGLFIFVAWVTGGTSFLGHNPFLIKPLGSAIGSTVLFLLYFILIDKHLQFYKGIGIALLTGVIASIAPLIEDIAVLFFKADIVVWGKLNLVFTLLVFVIWQTLFGWNIDRCRRAIAFVS